MCALAALRALLLTILALAGIQEERALTNADVVALLNAGMTPNLVNRLITTSRTAFDVTPEGLLSLKSSGVPDETMLVILQAEAESDQTTDSDDKSKSAAKPLYVMTVWYKPSAMRASADTLWLRTDGIEWEGSDGVRHLPWGDMKSLCFEPTRARLVGVKDALRLSLRDGSELFFRERDEGRVVGTSLGELQKEVTRIAPSIRCVGD